MKTKMLIGLIPVVLILALVLGAIGWGCDDDQVAEEPTPVPTEVPADTSLSDIQAKGKIIVGTDIPYGVMEFYDEDGNPVGIDMDLAREIASQIGVEMEVSSMPFDELFDALKNGTVDILVSAVTITPERQEEMSFSAPYLDAGMRIGVREDNESIASLDDLIDKKLGVLTGTVGEDLALESEYIDNSLVVSFQVNADRLAALQDGTVDAIIVHFLDEVEGVKTVGEALRVSYYGIVAKLSSDALMEEINSILREMKRDGTLDQIKAEYVS